MTIKPATLLTFDEASAQLHEARAGHARLLERIAAGDTKVKPADVADAQAQVQLAELRADAARHHDAERAELRRLDRIAELRVSVATGDLRTQLERIVKLYDQAVAVLRDLHDTTADYHSSMSATVRELTTLGAGETHPDAILIRGKTATVDGVLLDGDLQTPSELVAEAARDALASQAQTHSGGTHASTTLRKLQAAAPYSRSERLRSRLA